MVQWEHGSEVPGATHSLQISYADASSSLARSPTTNIVRLSGCYRRPTTTIINVPGLAAGRAPAFASSNSAVGR